MSAFDQSRGVRPELKNKLKVCAQVWQPAYFSELHLALKEVVSTTLLIYQTYMSENFLSEKLTHSVSLYSIFMVTCSQNEPSESQKKVHSFQVHLGEK